MPRKPVRILFDWVAEYALSVAIEAVVSEATKRAFARVWPEEGGGIIIMQAPDGDEEDEEEEEAEVVMPVPPKVVRKRKRAPKSMAPLSGRFR